MHRSTAASHRARPDAPFTVEAAGGLQAQRHLVETGRGVGAEVKRRMKSEPPTRTAEAPGSRAGRHPRASGGQDGHDRHHVGGRCLPGGLIACAVAPRKRRPRERSADRRSACGRCSARVRRLRCGEHRGHLSWQSRRSSLSGRASTVRPTVWLAYRTRTAVFKGNIFLLNSRQDWRRSPKNVAAEIS